MVGTIDDWTKDNRITVKDALQSFICIDQSIYLGNAQGRVAHHEDMKCDCRLESEEEDKGVACDERCINQMLCIECHPDVCPVGEYCQNQRFQRRHFPKVELVKTEKKGFGVRLLQDVQPNTLIFEYVGEVLTTEAFKKRIRQYHEEERSHFYFMSLTSDEVIDATRKGGLSRFVNHSCNPNCETQKWIVRGVLKIGIFTKKAIRQGEELTFDYNFERYGMEAQPCYCGESNCKSIIGGKRASKVVDNIEEFMMMDYASMNETEEEPTEEEMRCYPKKKRGRAMEVQLIYIIIILFIGIIQWM
jgi:SET domain-containing protein